MLCSRGYSDQLAGLSAAAIIVAGFLASFPLGLLAMKTGRLTTVCKVACVPAVVLLGLLCWVLVQPGLPELVLVSCVLLGVASLGIYPVMLELSVECTFPLDESVVTGLCYLSSALQVNRRPNHIRNKNNEDWEECALRTYFCPGSTILLKRVLLMFKL